MHTMSAYYPRSLCAMAQLGSKVMFVCIWNMVHAGMQDASGMHVNATLELSCTYTLVVDILVANNLCNLCFNLNCIPCAL